MTQVVLYGVGYPHRLNGAQKSLLNLLVGLREHAYRPVVVFSGEGRCVDAFAREGLDVRVLDVSPAFREYHKVWIRGSLRWRARAAVRGLPGVTSQVRKLIRTEGAVLAHFNDPRALLLFGWGAALTRRPLILHVRGGMGHYPTVLRFCSQMLPRRMILVGEGIRSDIFHPFQRKARVIYDSVEANDPAVEGRATGGDRPLMVLTLASFDPFKGYHHLVDAARTVSDAMGSRAVRFVWLGDEVDPQYATFVRNKVERLGLENVEIHDWVPDVRPYLQDADLLVHPTVEHETLELPGRTLDVHSGEGVPRALIEAMAFSKATVASRVGGIPEAVEDGSTGLLVPPSDAPALAAAMLELLRSPDVRKRMGERGFSLAQSRFSQETMVAGVIALYDELLSS